MPRIGTVIREVYHRPGGRALPAHLEDHYGLRVTGTARLAEGVFRVDHDGGPPWVARMFLASRPVDRTEEDAEVLRILGQRPLLCARCSRMLSAKWGGLGQEEIARLEHHDESLPKPVNK